MAEETPPARTEAPQKHRFLKAFCSKFCLIPQRWILGLMVCFCVCSAYMMRCAFAVTIAVMCKTARGPNETYTGDVPESELFSWGADVKGTLKSVFFWGYFFTHLPAALFADRWGCKWVLGIGFFMSAICTFVLPLIAMLNNEDHAKYVFIALRLLGGIGQGPIYPSINVLLADWVPKNERARIGTLSFCGAQIGSVIGNAVSGVLIKMSKSWTYPSYVFGFIGFVWCALWFVFCYNNPEQSPFISDKELNFLRENLPPSGPRKFPPWKAMFSNVPFWALFWVQWGHDWGLFNVQNELPQFINDVFGVDIMKIGIFTSLPYIAMLICALVSAWLSDWLVIHEKVSVLTARKIFTSISQSGPALFLILSSMPGIKNWAGNGLYISTVFFTIGMGLMGPFMCGFKVNGVDLSPKYAGTIGAITNGCGALTGVLAPEITGLLVKGKPKLTAEIESAWFKNFWVGFFWLVATNVLFIFFASADVQSFNDM